MKLPDLFRTLRGKIRIWIQNSVKEQFLSIPYRLEVKKATLPYVEESITLLEIGSHKPKQLRDEVESILMTSGHCDPADLSPYLEKDNQDQLIILKLILKLLYPSGSSHCSHPKVIETEALRNDMITVDLKFQDTQLNPKQNPMPEKTMTPRYKFKRIKKGGKVQKIHIPWGSQNEVQTF